MRNGPNFKQEMDPNSYAILPKLASYEGYAPDLQHLRGVYMKTVDVEKLVYVGELENVYVEEADGRRWQPWKGVNVIELNSKGEIDQSNWNYDEPIVPAGPRAMATADLFALGWSDAMLEEQAKSLFNEKYEPDKVGKSDKRREMFDRVMAALMG